MTRYRRKPEEAEVTSAPNGFLWVKCDGEGRCVLTQEELDRYWEKIKDPKCVFCAGTGRDIARFDCVCVPCRGTGKVGE